MANKFRGMIGICTTVESPPASGIWVEVVTEVVTTFSIFRDSRRIESKGEVIPELNLSNRFSALVSKKVFDNLQYIRYVTYSGVRWTVKDVEVGFPRMIFSVNGVYNGPTPSVPSL